MDSQVTVFSYQISSGKMWGYRFETAPVSGKRKWCSKRGYKTKGEAAKAGRDAQIQYESKGVVVHPSEMSYSDFIDKWIDSLKGVVKITTIENYTKKARLYLKPYLGSKKLKSITKDDIREVMLTLASSGCTKSEAGLAKNTISIIKAIIQKSFAFAVDEHMLTESPVAGRFPTPLIETYSTSRAANQKPHVYIPSFRIKEIFDRFPAGSPNHIALMLGYKCGLRIGEVFSVTWEDIDFNAKSLHVRRQVQWMSAPKNQKLPVDSKRRVSRHTDGGYGFWYLTNPKYNSERTITIDDDLVDLLLREKQQQDKDKAYYGEQYFNYYEDDKGRIVRSHDCGCKPVQFVNVRRDGEFISPRTMQHTSSVIHHSMNYNEFTFHSLRHTHATMLAENGASPMYVQHRLGHKNLTVTLRVYYHYTGKMENDGSEILSQMFNNSHEC